MQFALGFLAAFALLALVAFFRIRRWRRFRHGCFATSSVGLAGRRWPFRALFTRLDTSPAQEQVLVEAATSLREELSALRTEWVSARDELAALLGEPSIEPSRVEAVLASRDGQLAAMRRRAAEAAARFHGVLDEAQRKALAAMVREGHVLAHAHGYRRC
jgi:hypothetical protein